MTEEQIIQGCKKGKGKAQKALYDKYANLSFRICFRYLGNDHDAEDALISGFNKVFENIDRFEARANGGLEPWLKKIMINESLMMLRSRKQIYFEELTECSTTCQSINYLELDAEVIYSGIAKLNNSKRTIFNLFVVEGYSHQEIADKLNISIATSMSQLSRARKELQQLLNEYKSDYHGE